MVVAMARQYAGILGTLAFVTVIARALVEGGGEVSVMQTATLAMVVFALVGAVVGRLAAFLVDDAARGRLMREMATRQKAKERTASAG